MRRLFFLVAIFVLALSWQTPGAAQSPFFDTFLRSDYGNTFFYLNTRTGEFLWHDDKLKLMISGQGKLHFPSLGPIIFSFAGATEGFDWVSISMKIYGTSATGSMAVYPEGERVRKLVSNFYDKNTQDDMPSAKSKVSKTKRQPPKPKVEAINPTPSEIPLLPSP